MARILVVDDDELVLNAIESLLSYKGFDVKAVGGGREAISVLAQERFDAVIVDIFMPGMDGLETMKAFHQIAPEIPIIVMSGLHFRETSSGGAPNFLAMALQLGAARALQKPVRTGELVTAIEGCLARRAAARSSGVDGMERRRIV